MKVLLVNGSPHEDGCTNMALKEVSRALNESGVETEIFWIGNKSITGCIACNVCKKTGKCFIDDVVNRFNEKAKNVDGYIFGSPVHYAGASGSMTSFMDRIFYSGEKETFRLKPAAVVVSARRAGTTATYDQLNKYFGIMEMPIISSKYWNMVHGSTKEDVKKDEEGLQIMRTLGRNMAYFLKCIDIANKNNIPVPEKEIPIHTSFIR